MKRIILTESQYERLVRKRLDEQIMIFNPSYGYDDITTNRMMRFLVMLLDSIWYYFEENLYIKSIEGDKIVIDLEKYGDKSEEIKEFIKNELNHYFSLTDNPDDEVDSSGNIDFSFDTEPVDDETIEDVSIEDTEEIDDGKPEDEEEDDIVEGNCELTEEEQTLFDSKITNFKTANNFRWWVHQDDDRLKKVEKKLKSCGLSPEFDIVCEWTVDIESPIGSTFFENQYMNRYGNYLKIAFKLVGKDWVDAGNGGVRPKSEYTNTNGNLSNSDLTSIQDDIGGNAERLHKDAVDSWYKMVASAATDGTIITITDAYRPCGEPGDYERYLNKEVRFTQWAAWRQWNYKGKKAARPNPYKEEKWLKDGGGYCTSHHGFKGAVDISNGKKWMEKNAPKFGWCKYSVEKWHWDYYGDDIDNHLSRGGVNCK